MDCEADTSKAGWSQVPGKGELQREIRSRWVDGRLWTRSFGLARVDLGPGAQHVHAGEPEVWVVWTQPGWSSFKNLILAERRYLNAGTIADPHGQLTRPAWSMRDQALYDSATAAALVLLLEDDYPDRHIGALRLKSFSS